MKEMIRWGVIGCGGISRRRTIPEGIMVSDVAELIAVYDVNEQVNAEVASEFNAIKADSIEELLENDIQAVYIATPAFLHYEQVIQCAKAGKHVLCEKPIGMTVEEIDKMITVCNNAKVLLGTGLMMRFHCQHKAALEMIRDGFIGKPVSARAQLSCWYPPIDNAWRQDPIKGGGGALIDLGSHCIDLLEMFFGKVSKVSCFTNNSVHDYKSEDSAVATLFFENGVIATVDVFFCVPDNCSKNVLELFGANGSILANSTIGQGEIGQMKVYHGKDNSLYDAQQASSGDDGVLIKPEPINMYEAEIEEFSNAIIEGRIPSNNAQIGLENQRIIEACYQSAKLSKIVDI